MMYFIFLLYMAFSFAELSLEGQWKTIDDSTGKEKSIVVIEKQSSGLYSGKILKLLAPPSFTPKAPLEGLELLKDMKADSATEFSGGTIYDPKSDKTYRCNLTLLPDGTLKVRGFIGLSLFGRTQIWHRP